MLQSFYIKDFVIVEQLELDFQAGFTVFSGETGAGKSILIDALAIVLGAKADASILREGAQKAEISAEFSCPPTATAIRDWLQANDIDMEDSLLLKRTIDRNGKSKASMNGSMVTLTQLREIGEFLVDIHGQHAHQSLLKTDSQRILLDTQGGHTALVQAVRESWQTWQKLHQQLVDSQKNAAEQQEKLEQNRWKLRELEAVQLAEGEWETLQQEHQQLAHAQTLIEGTEQCINMVDDEADGIYKRINSICHQLESLSKHDPRLKTLAEQFESIRISLQDGSSDLSRYYHQLEIDPERYHTLDERIQNIFHTARKFRVTPEELPGLQQTVLQAIQQLEFSQDLEALQAAEAKAQKVYAEAAEALSSARKKQAATLSTAVTEAMQTLAMAGGRFEIALHPQAPSIHGTDHIEFLVAGHTGVSPKPLHKVASGGELARISLALSVIASQAAQVPTLIFDEVDTGVGGAVAEVVGQKLRALGTRHQVLCVTHLPQVASCGHQHILVHKQQNDGKTRSQLDYLDMEGRTNEIARMLGGIDITTTTLQHAEEMLARQTSDDRS